MPSATRPKTATRQQAIEAANASAFLGIPLAIAVPFTLDGASRIVRAVFAYDVARDEGTSLATVVVQLGLLLACSVVLASPAVLSLVALRRVEAPSAASPSDTRTPAPILMVLVNIGTALGLGSWIGSGLPVPSELGIATPTFTPGAAGLLTLAYGVLSLSMLVVSASSKPRETWD